MHPEILRELTAQRGVEMRARAHQARLARMAIRARRRGRDLIDEAHEFVLPAIPDYVDGSFRTQPASTGPVEDQAASEAGQAPAAHHAA
ncbi:MAG: hypothetical protein ACRDOH_13145 [Streptosporangiaceae bacterium]